MIPDYPLSHRTIINRAYIDAGLIPPNAAVEVNIVGMLDAIIRETDLITIFPSTQINAGLINLVALDVDLEFPHDDVGLASRQNTTLLPGARAVMELMRAQCAMLPGHTQTDVSR